MFMMDDITDGYDLCKKLNRKPDHKP